MNKRNYLFNIATITLLIISLICLFKFDIIENIDMQLYLYFLFYRRTLTPQQLCMEYYLYSLLISICIIMWYKKSSIKKLSSIYNVILILLSIFSLFIILSLGVHFITCILREEYLFNFESNGLWLLLIPIITLIFTNILDFNKQQNRINMLFTWIISLIFIFVFLRYQFDTNLEHNYITLKKYELQTSYIFVTQYYIYFNIIYFSLLIHHFINKKNTK